MKLHHVATALLLFPWTLPAAIFVGPNSNATVSVAPGSAALIFEVTSPIYVESLSVFADSGTLASSVSVQIRDYSNTLIGGATVTPSSTIENSVWATETLPTHLTLNPGTYSISGFGSYVFDFGAVTHATYTGLGIVTAYDSYYPTGSPTQSAIIGGGGTPSAPSAGAGWTALGDPKMRAVNFSFVAVPEPTTYAIFAGIGLLGFAVWRHGNRRGFAPQALLRRLE